MFVQGSHHNLAEEVGFEPTVPRGTTVFKTAAFSHSAIPPHIVRFFAPLFEPWRPKF